VEGIVVVSTTGVRPTDDDRLLPFATALLELDRISAPSLDTSRPAGGVAVAAPDEEVELPYVLEFEERVRFRVEGSQVILEDAEGSHFTPPMASNKGLGRTIDWGRSTFWPPFDLDVRFD
jgi:hypothetical protein